MEPEFDFVEGAELQGEDNGESQPIDPQFLFEVSMVAGIQELFQRIIAVENVLVDVVTIISENAESPHHMADLLKELLAVPEPQDDENKEG